MDCEICGRQIYGKGRGVIIDGAKLMVCSDCAQFATEAPQTYKQQTAGTKKSTSAPVRQQRPVRREETIIREDLELVEDYRSIVRKARESLGLTHEELSRKIGEKVSFLQKLETGKMVPNQALAKKLEYALKIKLLQTASRVPVEEEFAKKPAERTLGDFVSMQQKKDERAEG